MAWSYTAQALNFFIAFGSSLVVARLVTLREFGIFAMAGAITSILAILFSVGLATYIVREEQIDTPKLRSVFTVNVLLTSLLATAFFSAGLAATHVFDSPDVGQFLRLYSIVPLISMFEFVPQALLSRDMRFKAVSLLSLLRTASLYGTIILLAANGFGHMSFAWGMVASAAASTIVCQFLLWKPSVWLPRLEGFRAILKFGLQMISITGFSQFSTRASEMVLGSGLGLATLGLYARASSLSSQLYQNIYGGATAVVFAKLSADLREKGNFHDVYLRALRLLLAVTWPMLGGLAVLSAPAIYHLYGAQWLGASLPLTLLLIAYAIALGFAMEREVFVLRGETSRQVKIEAARATVGFALFSAGTLIGVAAAAAARIVETLLAYLLYRPHMDRLVGTTRGELDRIYWEGLLLSLAAVLPSFALMLWYGWSPRTPLPLVAGAVLLGVFGWAGLVFLRRHVLLEELQRALRPLRRRSSVESLGGTN